MILDAVKWIPAALITLILTCCHSAALSPVSASGDATLYRRLGGYDAIAAVTDDFLTRLLGDPKMQPYFEHVDAAGTNRIRQMIVDQLCAASGGAWGFVGGGMPAARKDPQNNDRPLYVGGRDPPP